MPEVVVDTHTIVWYLASDPRLSTNAAEALDSATAAGELEEITVTAQKRSESEQNVPMSITTFGAVAFDPDVVRDERDPRYARRSDQWMAGPLPRSEHRFYARIDNDEMFVFDHVEAQVIKRDKVGVTIKISNPTKFDAQVATLTEDGPQAQGPLGPAAFLNWPKVEIKSGATVQITLAADRHLGVGQPGRD